MQLDSGDILRGYPLLRGVICPNVVPGVGQVGFWGRAAYNRANSYPWGPITPRQARPGPGPHRAFLSGRRSSTPFNGSLFARERSDGIHSQRSWEGASPPPKHSCIVLGTTKNTAHAQNALTYSRQTLQIYCTNAKDTTQTLYYC